MPEGPYLVILKEAVEELHIKGEKIDDADGNCQIDLERIVDQKIIDFRTFGKNFLICFEDFTLRIHFMLFGSYLINERKLTPARLRLNVKDAELNFYACSVNLLERPVDEIYDWESDIMADEWNANKAFQKLINSPKMFACDALLDQNIFAGSGNIIKNEVLFRIGTHPLSLLGEIPDSKLEEMIQETRNYSFEFLQWKREFTLKNHWLAHTKKTCPHCSFPFQKEYLGKSKRRSYFCTKCQKHYDN